IKRMPGTDRAKAPVTVQFHDVAVEQLAGDARGEHQRAQSEAQGDGGALVDQRLLIDWLRFQRRNLNDAIVVEGGSVAAFCCGDSEQAVLWLLRTDAIGADGRIDRTLPAVDLQIAVPDLSPGNYRITYWDTEGARAVGE